MTSKKLISPSGLQTETFDFKNNYARLAKMFEDAPVSNRYVFGINVYTKAIIEKFRVSAIIDDFTEIEEFMNTPIISSAEFTKLTQNKLNEIQNIVLIASGGNPHTARKKLSLAAGNRSVIIDYFGFQKSSPTSFPEIIMNEGFEEIYNESYTRFQYIYSKFSDLESQASFKNIINFRYTQDIKYLTNFKDIQNRQYFEPFIQYMGIDNFIDIGSFDGANTRTFIELFPNFNKVIAVEPVPANFDLLSKNLRQVKSAVIVNSGVGKQASDIYISGTGRTAKIVNKPHAKQPEKDMQLSVPLQTVDNLIKINRVDGNSLSYMKMDIEGMELDALHGSSEFIQSHRPILGICVYHHPLDLVSIPEFILGLNPDYDLYLRHYTESIYETVMYFIPK